MLKEKGPEWNYVTVLADGGDKGLAYVTMECLRCDKSYNGGPKRIRAILIGGDSCLLKCKKVPNDVINAVKAQEEQTKKVAQDKKRKIEHLQNRPNIQTYALCTFTFSLQTFTIFFLINAFINVYYNFFDVYHIYASLISPHLT